MLDVKGLTKEYGKIRSVTDISFTIKEREVVGLLGPNGAGKSTTMRMLTGYLAPTRGSVHILGEDVFENPIPARRYIGYLPEIPPLYIQMTVREQLKFICDLRGIKAARAPAEIDRVCKALHIDDVASRPIRNLSKGYRQRVGFAAAIVGEPKLLILDEPTVGLDPRQIIEIRNLIQELSKSMSVIISSHILSEISSVCDRVIIMKKGRIVADGTQAAIEQNFGGSNKVEVAVRGDSEGAVNLLRECAAGIQVENIRQSGGESVFHVEADGESDLRERIFKAFAKRESEFSLVTLRSMQKTLEDIFIDITRS